MWRIRSDDGLRTIVEAASGAGFSQIAGVLRYRRGREFKPVSRRSGFGVHSERYGWVVAAADTKSPDRAGPGPPSPSVDAIRPARLTRATDSLVAIDSAGVYEGGAYISLSGSIHGGNHGVVAETLTLELPDIGLDGALPRRRRGFRFFKNGYQSWSETTVYDRHDTEWNPILKPMRELQDNLRNLPTGSPGSYRSDLFAVVGNEETGSYLLVGGLAVERENVYVRTARSRGGLRIVVDFGGVIVSPRGRREWGPVAILAGSNPYSLVEEYAELVTKRIPARVPDTGFVPGWCSWYYYFTQPTAGEIRKNARLLSSHDSCVRYLVIDDGYEASIGDWTRTNDGFPDDPSVMAKEIESHGLIPGIWLAPLIAGRSSRLLRDHPGWFLATHSGRPVRAAWNPNWGEDARFYALDVGHPEVQEYLRNLISVFVQEWGFRYLKLDFMYAGAMYGVSVNHSLSPIERLGLAFRIIRDSAGEDVYILGCGSPFGPAVGQVDAMRTGPDVAPYWNDFIRHKLTRDPHAVCTRFAVRNVLLRCAFHRVWWNSDPDCLLLRRRQTRLSDGERRTLVNSVVVTGGSPVISDDVELYTDEDWAMLRKICRLSRRSANERARLLSVSCGGELIWVHNRAGLLGCFNISEKPQRASILFDGRHGVLAHAEASLIVRNVWSDERLEIRDGALDAGVLAPHESVLFDLGEPS